MPDLSVCIVNWNTRGELETCLRSIEATRGKLRVEVIVVDNASTDGSAEMVAERFPAVHLIRNADNRGFAAATNQALRARHADYALLLNPDIVVCPGALQALHHFLETTPDAGAVTGMLVDPSGRLQSNYYARDHGLLTWLALTANTFSWNLWPAQMIRLTRAGLELNGPSELELMPGGCFMVREQVLAEAGMLDEDFFLLHEDDEWSRRIRVAGWKLYFCPAGSFVHKGGTSFEAWSQSQRGAQFLASRMLFLDKHYPKVAMFFGRLALASNFVIHLGIAVIARRFGLARSGDHLSVRDRLLWVRVVLRRI